MIDYKNRAFAVFLCKKLVLIFEVNKYVIYEKTNRTLYIFF